MSGFRVGGVVLPHGPYMIGAGVCKTPSATKEWLKIAPVVSGSYTPEHRTGNQGLVFWPDTLDEFLKMGYGLNGYGMPNMGIEPAAVELSALKSEHPLVASIAGFSATDYLSGVQTFSQSDNISAIELNFGCPNTQGDHPDIISFNPPVVREILEGVADSGYRKPIWQKFSPYSNPAELKRMAELLNGFADSLELAVVACNTFPNAYAGEGKIDPNNGLAGLSGPAMKPIALGQVRQFRQYLKPSIDVIGVGGVTTGDDIMDFIDAGAAGVQITSLGHWSGNPRTFQDRLFDEAAASRFLQYVDSNN